MTSTEIYEALRDLADSWGLMAMFACFLVLVWWPFRPGARRVNDEVARMIFEDEDANPVIFGGEDARKMIFGGEDNDK